MVRDLTGRCETVERERDELKTSLQEAQAESTEAQELERTLRNTLVIAQRSADELKEQSRLEAAETLEDARAQAAAIVGEAERRAAALQASIRTLEEREHETRQRFADMLRSALGQLERDAEAMDAGVAKSLLDDLRPSSERV
jgi:cell division initiation protein